MLSFDAYIFITLIPENITNAIWYQYYNIIFITYITLHAREQHSNDFTKVYEMSFWLYLVNTAKFLAVCWSEPLLQALHKSFWDLLEKTASPGALPEE